MVTEEIKITQEIPIHTVPTAFEFRYNLIAEVAEEVHPDCWDLGPTTESSLQRMYGENTNRLIITIPEAIVRNRRGLTHKIKDFHIAIVFTSDYRKLVGQQLVSFRSTVNTVEYACGVFHPHSRGVSYNESLSTYFSWRNMCLGGQTALTDIVYSLYSDGLTKKYMYELMTLLHVYARWESEEGGPYMSMKNYTYPSTTPGGLPPFPFTDILNLVLKAMLDREDNSIPEIVGHSDRSAITNTIPFFSPLIKDALIEFAYLHFPEDPFVWVGNFVGVNSSDHRFAPLFINNNCTSGLTFYTSVIARVDEFSSSKASSLLNLKGVPVTLVMELEPKGLVNSEYLPITAEAIQLADVRLSLVRDIANNYLNLVKTFKNLKKLN